VVGTIRGFLLCVVCLGQGCVDLGVMRRGCVVEALRKFIISQGPSKNINNLEWDSFWAENKKAIDPIAKRFTCITALNR
jgi:glutamyl-tRNA synthetase